MTDDEKYLWKGTSLEDQRRYMRENVKDIVALGFDIEKTFIFSNFAYMGHMYPLVVQIQRLISAHTAAMAFGFDDQVELFISFIFFYLFFFQKKKP